MKKQEARKWESKKVMTSPKSRKLTKACAEKSSDKNKGTGKEANFNKFRKRTNA